MFVIFISFAMFIPIWFCNSYAFKKASDIKEHLQLKKPDCGSFGQLEPFQLSQSLACLNVYPCLIFDDVCFCLSRLQFNLVDLSLSVALRFVFIATEADKVFWHLDFPDLLNIRFNPTSLDD